LRPIFPDRVRELLIGYSACIVTGLPQIGTCGNADSVAVAENDCKLSCFRGLSQKLLLKPFAARHAKGIARKADVFVGSKRKGLRDKTAFGIGQSKRLLHLVAAPYRTTIVLYSLAGVKYFIRFIINTPKGSHIYNSLFTDALPLVRL
jgi:hypothetical protein